MALLGLLSECINQQENSPQAPDHVLLSPEVPLLCITEELAHVGQRHPLKRFKPIRHPRQHLEHLCAPSFAAFLFFNLGHKFLLLLHVLCAVSITCNCAAHFIGGVFFVRLLIHNGEELEKGHSISTLGSTYQDSGFSWNPESSDKALTAVYSQHYLGWKLRYRLEIQICRAVCVSYTAVQH